MRGVNQINNQYALGHLTEAEYMAQCEIYRGILTMTSAPAYKVHLMCTAGFEDGNTSLIWQEFMLFSGMSLKTAIVNPQWGDKVNQTISGLLMNLFYALNRTFIVRVERKGSKKGSRKGKGRKSRKKGQIKRQPPYTLLRMDTEFKRTIQTKRAKDNGSSDEHLPSGKKVIPHRRRGTWKPVWVLKHNIRSWEKPSEKKQSNKTDNMLYRVVRWSVGYGVNGWKPGDTPTKPTTHIKKW